MVRIFGTALALLLVVLLVVYTDWSAVVSTLSDVSAEHLVAGFFVVQIQIVLSAFRWRFTASRLGQRISASRAIVEYYISTGANQLLPGGVAGDALRAYRGRQLDGAGIVLTAMSVAFERLSGQAALLVFVILSIVLWPHEIYGYNKPLIISLLLSVVAVTLILILPILKSRLPSVASHLALAFWKDGAGLYQASTSMVIVGSYIGLFALCAQATGYPLSLVDTLIVVPVCLLTMVLPSGFGGWGTREAAAAALWPLVGLTSDQGIAASILYGAIAMLGAAPGLLILLLRGHK